MPCYSHAVLASTDATVSDPPRSPKLAADKAPTERTTQRLNGTARARQALRRFPQLIRHHPGLVVVLVLGGILRIATSYAYGPAFYFSDTRGYFEYADLGIPQAIRGYGYSAFLNLFRWTGSIWPITITQHALGLACVIALYALVLRKGGPRWLALLVAIPAALDGYTLVVEHYLLGDSLFTFFILAGLICLVWQEKLSTSMAIVGGVFLAFALLTRAVAVPVIILAGFYVMVRKVGWKPFISLVLAVAIPTLSYTVWFHHYYGQYTLSTWTDRWMYGRMMSIADCENLHLNPPEQKLCTRPENENAYKVDYYVWSADSPVGRIPRRYAYTFSAKVALQQPGDYARLITRETWTFFSLDFYLNRKEPVGTTCPTIWELPYQVENPACSANPVASSQFGDRRGAAPEVWEGVLPKLLHDYQRYGGVAPGPLLAICLLLVLAAVLAPLLARSRGLPRQSNAWRLRWDALLLGASGLALLVMAVAQSQFDIRYGVPILALIPPAGALAWISLRSTLLPHRNSPKATPADK